MAYIPKAKDKIIIPGKYETYDEMMTRIDLIGKVTLIQRNFRRYLWMKLVKESAAQWRCLVKEQNSRENIRKDEHENIFKKECIVKTYPKTKEDFDALYAQVQVWKEKEVKRISEEYSGAPKISELNILLDKEVQLLNGIDKQKQKLGEKIKKTRSDKLLAHLGEPVKWVGYKSEWQMCGYIE